MCGRYKLSAEHDSVWEHFDILGEIPFEFVPRYNIATTQPIAVVRQPPTLEPLRWGIKIPNPRAGGFNVRVESLGAPFCRDSLPWPALPDHAEAFTSGKSLGTPPRRSRQSSRI